MEQGKNRLFEWLTGINPIPENVNIDFKYVPFDNKLLEVAWNSPNDGKKNLIQFLMEPKELDRIELEDNH